MLTPFPARAMRLVAAFGSALVLLSSGSGASPFAPPPVSAAGYVVTTLDDSGVGSLRQAMLDANASPEPDTITFGLSGAITLLTPLPKTASAVTAGKLTIDGAGQAVTISGNNANRVLEVDQFGVAEFRNLTLANGNRSGGCLCGGALYVGEHADLTLVNSTITASTSPLNGGGVYLNQLGSLTIAGSTIAGNSSGNGGGIYANGQLRVTNSTITGNTASGNGGGVHNNGNIWLTQSTVSHNSAAGAGGGLRGNLGDGLLKNNILANNTAPSGPDCSGILVGEGVNLRQNPAGCSLTGGTLLAGDPMLGALASNGGPTQTRNLGAGSPALSVGDATTCATAPVSGVDQRGAARPQGAGCDLGAFESSLTGSVGGKNLRITTGSIDLGWDAGSVQTGYTLLRYNTSTAATDLIALAAPATAYSDAAAANGVVYCYVLAATGPSGLLGLSDLLCAMAGQQSGAVIPGAFTLALNQTATATLTWTPPADGGAESYLLVRIPLDGSPVDNVVLGGGATSTTQAVTAAGACFQLVAYRGAGFGISDVLCGVPGISTLSGVSGAAEALQRVAGSVPAVARW